MNEALRVIDRVHEAGGEVFMRGETLKLRAPKPLPDEIVEEVRRVKPALIALLRDGASTAEEGCGCLVCKPDLWPNGYEEVVSTWSKRDQRRFDEVVRVRRNAGLPLGQAERLSYLDGLNDIRRRARRRG